MWGRNPLGLMARNGLLGVISALLIFVPAATANATDVSSSATPSLDSTLAQSAPAAAGPTQATAQAAKSELIVKFTAGSTAKQQQEAVESAGGMLEQRVGQNLIDAAVVQVDPSKRNQISASLEQSSAVQYAEPNQIVHTLDVPNDPLFGQLWNLRNDGSNGGTAGADIHAVEAWTKSRGSCSVVVAISDTGIDASHPDLASNIWVNPNEIPNNGIDDDKDGYVDDIHGIDVVRGDGDPNDEHGHGTHVAGTIGAVGNNGIGVTGVTQRAQLMGAKFLDGNGYGTTSDAITAINFAVAHGAKVINASWGGGGYEQALRDSIKAAGAAGVTFVTASGNSAINLDASPQYPASFDEPNIITVAASDRYGEFASDYSNYGANSVDIVAPGTDILSTVPGGYATFSGTSMATPNVSGAAAVLLASNPGASPAQIRSAIMAGSDPKPQFAGLVASNGGLNVAGALNVLGGGPGPDTSTECDGNLNHTKAQPTKPTSFRLLTPKLGAVYKTHKNKAQILVKWTASTDSSGLQRYLVKVNGRTIKTLDTADKTISSSSSPPTRTKIRLAGGAKRAKRYHVYIVAQNFQGLQRKSSTTAGNQTGSNSGQTFYVKRLKH